jgi:hypothetical protein
MSTWVFEISKTKNGASATIGGRESSNGERRGGEGKEKGEDWCSRWKNS